MVEFRKNDLIYSQKKARDKILPDNKAAIIIQLPYEEFRGKTDVGLFEFREVEKRNEVGKSNRGGRGDKPRGKSERADYGRGRAERSAQIFEVGVAAALREPFAVFVGHERHVQKLRRVEAEQTIQIDLPRRRGQKIGSAHDFGHV